MAVHRATVTRLRERVKGVSGTFYYSLHCFAQFIVYGGGTEHVPSEPDKCNVSSVIQDVFADARTQKLGSEMGKLWCHVSQPSLGKLT
jgi:hypothetical protein